MEASKTAEISFSEIILNACRVYSLSSVSELRQLHRMRKKEGTDKLNDVQTFCYRLVFGVITLLIFHCIEAIKTKV